jgi:hypothetical protein
MRYSQIAHTAAYLMYDYVRQGYEVESAHSSAA